MGLGMQSHRPGMQPPKAFSLNLGAVQSRINEEDEEEKDH